MKPKLSDISTRIAARPLDLSRAKIQPENALKISKKKRFASQAGGSAGRSFDISIGSKSEKDSGLFVPETKSRLSPQRLKLAISGSVLAAVIVFASTIGSGLTAVRSVAGDTAAGLQHLLGAGQSLAGGDFSAAESSFAEARDRLAAAQKNIQIAAGSSTALATKPALIQSGSELVAASVQLASAGERLAGIAGKLSTSLAAWPDRNAAWQAGEPVPSFAAEVASLAGEFRLATSEILAASEQLDRVSPASLPPELAAQIERARGELASVRALLQPASELARLAPELIGDTSPRRYLLLFQNSDELRPTGGFLGSFAEVQLNNGFVDSFEIRDIYEIDGQLAAKETPPPGFEAITDRLGMRDANFSPDFPTAAREVLRLYEMSRASRGSVDGVLAVNSDLLEKLVSETGGVEIARLGRSAQADEIVPLLSLIIESKIDNPAAPKDAILNEVGAVLAAKIKTLPPEQLARLALDSVLTREIQFFSRDAEAQSALAGAGLAGAFPTPTPGQDFFAAAVTSLSGNKSDRFVATEIFHDSEFLAPGEYQNTITIRRSHEFRPADELKLRGLAAELGIELDARLLNILGRGENRARITLTLPAGIQVQQLTGAEILAQNQTESATEITFQLNTPAGKTSEAELDFTIQNLDPSRYELAVWQQSGQRPIRLVKRVTESAADLVYRELTIDRDTIISSPIR